MVQTASCRFCGYYIDVEIAVLNTEARCLRQLRNREAE
jgi:hypothetical protein